MPKWSCSGAKGEVIVDANTEEEARHLAMEHWWKGVPCAQNLMPIGGRYQGHGLLVKQVKD